MRQVEVSLFDGVINLYLFINVSKSPCAIDEMPSASPEQNPVITIGVPTYNSSPSLPHFLSALENLDYPKNRIRILFVDNYSTDDTTNRIRQFLRERGGFYERVLMLSVKSNIPQARNLRIEHSAGDYMLFLDSDVIPPQNTAKRMLEIFHTNPDVAMVGFQYRSRFETNSESSGLVKSYPEPHSTLFAQAGCMMIKLWLIKKIGKFNTLFLFDEDLEFSIRAFRAGYRAIIDSTQSVLHLNAGTSQVTNRGSVMAFLFVLKSKGAELLPSRCESMGSALQKSSHETSFQSSLPVILCLVFWEPAVTFALIAFYSISSALQSFGGRKVTVAEAIGLSWLGLPLLVSFAIFRSPKLSMTKPSR